MEPLHLLNQVSTYGWFQTLSKLFNLFLEKWVYIETMLEGGRVLTVEPDKHHVWMHGKTGNDNQMWRLEDNGCLRNKAHMDRCLGTVEHIVGSGLDLQIDGGGIGSQQWRYKDKYLVNLVLSNSLLILTKLLIFTSG